MTKEERRELISQKFYDYFCNCVRATGKCVLVQPSSVKQYIKNLEPSVLFEYNLERWKEIESIFDITDKEQLISIYDELMESRDFKAVDNRRFRQTALANYITFFRVMDFFEVKTLTSVPKGNPYDKGKNILYYGAPGTGKSYKVKEITDGYPHWRVTFHPDTDYSSFVGCYKPTMRGDKVQYAFVPQTFLKAYVAAWKSLLKTSDEVSMNYLIIEELNRGNCAQIFGDLFQLLDRKSGDYAGYSTYTIQADTEIEKYLEKELQGTGYLDVLKEVYKSEFANQDNVSYATMALPTNLSLVATMNTSDQSLYPMDSAFKRRWDWIYVPINTAKQANTLLLIGDNKYKWSDVLHLINMKIKELQQSTDKQLGEWFVKPDSSNRINFTQFRDKVLFFLFNDALRDESSFSNLFKADPNSDGVFLFEDLQLLDGNAEAEYEALESVNRFLKAIGAKPLEQEVDETDETSEPIVETEDGDEETA